MSEEGGARGQLLDVEGCGESRAGCVPESVAHAEICARSTAPLACTATDGQGRFALAGLEASSASFEVKVDAPARRLVVLTGARLVPRASGLRIELAPAADLEGVDLSSLRVASAPLAAGVAIGIDVIRDAARGSGSGEVTAALTRLPVAGEAWTLRARLARDGRELELARLVGLAPVQDRARLPRQLLRGPIPTDRDGSRIVRAAAPSGEAAIAAKYTETGGSSGPLGPSTSGVQSTPSGGTLQRFQSGVIVWSAATGAHEVHGRIFEKYREWGLEAGALGYPLSDEVRAPDGVGRFGYFQAGAIYWTPATGAHAVYGEIVVRWGIHGFERGFLKYPVTDSLVAPDGVGIYSHFEGGVIYWSPSTGAHEVHGEILSKWASLGWERSVLGYPTTDEGIAADGTGRYSHFSNQGSIYWSPSSGAHEVHGRIRDRWAAAGHERSALGYPVSDELDGGNGLRTSRFQNGNINFKVHGPPLEVYAQNMAYLVFPGSYGGPDKLASLDALKEVLKSERPDIVGLSEMFENEMRERLLEDPAIRAMYPFDLDGPDEPLDPISDGGLMLLSRFPIREQDTIVYRTCRGEDCGANKGILYAKLEVAPGVTYDVFLSHLQNRTPLVGGEASGEIAKQFDVLGSFVEAKRGTRQTPAILLGDFNSDGRDPVRYESMMSRLQRPLDAWVATHPGDPGITADVETTFEEGSFCDFTTPGRRFQRGERLDYVLVHAGDRFQANLRDAEIVTKQHASGCFDMSDHYGLLASFDPSTELDVVYTGRLTRVEAKLRRFHCFDVTNGTAPLGTSDEVRWQLGMGINGASPSSRPSTGLIENINQDTIFSFASPLLVRANDASSYRVEVEGTEIDRVCAPFCVQTGAVSLDRRTLTFSREQLFEALSTPRSYGLGMMRGDGGEYMATVELTAVK